MKNKSETIHCFVDYGFKRVGGKYKGRILWVLKDGVSKVWGIKKSYCWNYSKKC